MFEELAFSLTLRRLGYPPGQTAEQSRNRIAVLTQQRPDLLEEIDAAIEYGCEEALARLKS